MLRSAVVPTLALVLLSSAALAQTYTSPTFQAPLIRGGPAGPTGAVNRAYMDARMGSRMIVTDPAFGGTCTGTTGDDTAAFQAAMNAAASVPFGAVVEVPRGCIITAPVAVTLGANRHIHLRGAGGRGSILSANGSGVVVTIADGTASFDASDLAFLRTGIAQAGIGLDVRASVVQLQHISHFRSLLFSGTAISGGTGAWAEGLRLAGLSAPVVDGVRTFLPDGTGSSTGMGLHITGNAGHYQTDTKISGSLFQGGGAGIYVDGAVQGVFMTGSEAIGNDWGLYASDPGGANLIELMSITGNHFNNVLGGLYLGYTSQNQVSNNQFLHLSPAPGRAWFGILADHSGWNAFSNNSTIGAAVGAETFIRLSGSYQLNTVTGNNMVTLSGPCIDATDSFNTVASGNSCQNAAEPGIALGLDGRSFASGNVVNGRNEVVGQRSGRAILDGDGVAMSTGFASFSARSAPAAGADQNSATPITTLYTVAAAVPAGSGYRLPPVSALPANLMTQIILVNRTGVPVRIYPGIETGVQPDTIIQANAGGFMGDSGTARTVCEWQGQGAAWDCRAN